MKIAYADPPYIGQAKKHYGDQELCEEVDHADMVSRLLEFDGWALSLSSPTLKQILNLCPDDVRIGAWVKPFAYYKPGVNPAYAWEPVIFWGGRRRGRDEDTIRDWVMANATMKKGLHGVKPMQVSYWLFEMLGAQPGDDFTDMFPGSGAVSLAWDNFTHQTTFDSLPLWAVK